MKKQSSLSAEQIDRIIEMAWEDRTPFDAILIQFGLKEEAVIKLMRSEIKPSSFKMWRSRVQGRKTKHLKSGPIISIDLNVVDREESAIIKFQKNNFILSSKKFSVRPINS